MTDDTLPPGTGPASPDQAFRLAVDHYGAGRIAQAAALLDRIVQASPDHGPSWQLLAVMVHERGRTAEAVRLMDRAIQAAPGEAQYHANRGEMQRRLGNLDAAIADGEMAVRLAPRAPVAHGNLGIAWYDKGDLAKAEACQRAALGLDPGFLPALNNLGSIARDRRDRVAAAAFYREVLARHPGHVEAANNLGALFVEQEDPESALELFAGVLREWPRHAEALCNAGNAHLALEDFARAEAHFLQALQAHPGMGEAQEGLARCYQELGRLSEAEALARSAMARQEQAPTLVLLGGIQSAQGYAGQAMDAYDRALEMAPELPTAWMGKGHLLLELGKLEAAERCFQRAHELNPDVIAPRLAMAQVRKTRPDDANFAALREAAAHIEELPPTRAIPLHYALGKAYDDLGQYDEAFPHFLAGARLKRERQPYSAENNRQIADNLRRQFSPETIARLGGAGNPSTTPIFVLGMPRSGTTLTETIIASHPDVHGAGELPDLLHLVGQPLGHPPQGYPLNVDAMTPGLLAAMADDYLSRLRLRAPGAARITDKMPANFLGIGMIHLMLPNAKIVHVKRNPIDTCVSGFTKLFSRGQPHSYDLREIGRYYRDYWNVMAHWHRVLPPGAFHEIQYEDLVANQEEETRKLIAYCGLEWNDACLAPHKAERSVRTASITQVRQPVYTSSVERWRVYEKFLAPLLDELRELLPPA